MNKIAEMMFRRFNKVYLDEFGKDGYSLKADIPFVSTVSKNLEAYGYFLSKDAFESLIGINRHKVAFLYADIVKKIESVKGCQFKPFYVNFPEQVMSASDSELYINAIIHYWGSYLFGTSILPDVEEKSRPVINEKHPLTEIGIVKNGEIKDFYQNLLGSKTAWSQQDIEDVGILVNAFPSVVIESVPCKENLATVVGIFRSQGRKTYSLAHLFKTVTDVLRYAVKISGGDVSLSEPPVFGKMKRSDRAFIKNVLEKICAKDIGTAIDDMYRFKPYWERLAEKIHPHEKSDFNYNLKMAYSSLYKKYGFKTQASIVENGIKNGDWNQVKEVLSHRPGEMARRLDHLLRTQDPYEVLSLFREVAEQVSTQVLMQVRTHFQKRLGLRVAMPKGNLTTATILPFHKNDEAMSYASDEVVGICESALLQRFKKLPALGKVYIDPELKGYNIPFAMRSASSTGMKTLVRGTKTALEGRKYLRFFVWWKGYGVDIDLSATALDANFNKVADICFYNLRENWACHSGDIVTAPNGAAEYIDIDTREAVNRGIRYVLMSVISFRGTPYKEIEECCGGYIERDLQSTGKIHEIKTVKQCFRLTGDTTSNLAMAFDLIENKMVWMDISLKRRFAYCNTVGKSGTGIVNGIKALVCGKRPNLYDLLTIHATARGEIVDRKEHADTVFDCEGIGIRHEKVSSEYL
ncbi:MAG: TerD family protein [Candidatus Omnitrophica bacterium]|nr:TerD family protein [Candidatus Omnitrophota bacterium]